MINPIEAIFWTEKIIAIAIFFQTLELIQIRNAYSEKGTWAWNTLKKEFEIFPVFFQKIIGVFLKYPNFLYLLFLRLFSALLILFFPHPILIFILFFSTIFVCLRWRGVFNGGSDYMTIVVLSALCFFEIFKGSVNSSLICLWYISIQVCSSYFISGLVKIKKKNWRTGKALSGFINSSIYQSTPGTELISSNLRFSCLVSWIIILFELSFPLTLFSPQLCLAYIAFALAFHLANFYIFGLNRFLFAWAASYPALYFCSNFSNFSA